MTKETKEILQVLFYKYAHTSELNNLRYLTESDFLELANDESFPVEKPVGMPSETLSCEPKVENPFTEKFFDWVDKYIKEEQLKGRIKECEYWRDQIFAPEFSSMKVITLFDFSTRLAELEASKP